MTDEQAPARRRLGKRERHEHIVKELMTSSALRVSELAAELDVSTETIRRDLLELGEKGLIDRTYGGAARPLGAEPTVAERHRMMVPEREAIAKLTAQLIRPNDVLMIGGGATTTHAARRIAAVCRDLTVITHAFGIATVMAANPTITVIMAPGRYNAREGNMGGPETNEFLEAYSANWAILGASGITAEGVSEAEPLAASVYKTMMHRAAGTVIVADHTKFDQHALSIWARWSGIDHLVTDRAPTGALARALTHGRVGVKVTGGF